MTPERKATLNAIGWQYVGGCMCQLCCEFRRDVGTAQSASNISYCTRHAGHSGPCNGFPRTLLGGRACFSTIAQIKPADLHDKAEKAPAGTNPKDLLGILKLPLRLFPAPALAFACRVFDLGAKKYGAYNWRLNAVKRTVYLEAALRHILTALDGEDLDPESGEPHEAHALACMAIILDAKATGNLIDDRPTKGVFGSMVQAMQKKVA